MIATQEITFPWGKVHPVRPPAPAGPAIPRVARLLALAIQMERLVREQSVRDYAAVARAGWVTRARMTQIIKLLDLAPDLQEQILFLPPLPRLNERNLRPIACLLDWQAQRKLFQQLVGGSHAEPLSASRGRQTR